MISLNDIVSPFNAIVVALLRSPLHGVASKGLMLVSWDGQRSGKRFTTPVGYQREGRRAVIVMLSKPAEKTWWKNFRSAWPAELTIRGRTYSASGQWLEPGSPEFFTRIETTLQRLPWMGKQFGIEYDRGSSLDAAQREKLSKKCGAIRFELLD
jgi:hypothetical protein